MVPAVNVLATDTGLLQRIKKGEDEQTWEVCLRIRIVLLKLISHNHVTQRGK
jgi:hypothetical protein